MDKKVIVAFDLSSKVIGVTVAKLKKKNIQDIMVFPIIPKRADGKLFGFTTKNKKKVELRGGQTINTFLKEGEVTISKKEAARRNRMVKEEAHTYLLKDIGKQLGYILFELQPDVIVLERNEAFGGILTTKLLGEIAGGIYFWAGFFDVELASYNARTMRSLLNKHVRGADVRNGDGELIVDTKMIVKRKLEKFYEDNLGVKVEGWDNATLDESDALMAFTYYYMTEELELDE